MSSEARIILTRQKQRNQPWLQTLVAAGVQVLALPLLRFEALDISLDELAASHDWILFTSPQGVDAFVASGLKTNGAKLGALGSGTSAALHAHSFPDNLGFNGLDGVELAEAFIAKVDAPATVLLPGAARRMEEPRISLEEAGFVVIEVPTYKTLPISPVELKAEFHSNDVIFFCSPSAVRAFVAAFTDRPDCVAIGETTATVCRENCFPTQVAQTPDLNAMVRAAGCEPLTTFTENES